MPVAAGIIGDLRIGALLVLAARDMAAERCRAAVLDRRHHLELAEADMAGVGSAPRRAMAAEDIPTLQPWMSHAARASGGRPGLGLLFDRLLGLVLVGPQRREAIERAHDLADRIGGDARVERRGLELGMTQQNLDH